MRRIVASLGYLLLTISGLSYFGSGVYLYTKAQVAQVLLQHAWIRICHGELQVRPWSWADTYPMARLRLPDHGIKRIILAGCSGRTLAFGPGHFAGTALPGAHGNCVISAHRDTHFSFLKNVRLGDEILLDLPSGRTARYLVREKKIVHQLDLSVLAESEEPLLTLITCYPYDTLVPGGPLRSVIVAQSQ